MFASIIICPTPPTVKLCQYTCQKQFICHVCASQGHIKSGACMVLRHWVRLSSSHFCISLESAPQGSATALRPLFAPLTIQIGLHWHEKGAFDRISEPLAEDSRY